VDVLLSSSGSTVVSVSRFLLYGLDIAFGASLIVLTSAVSIGDGDVSKSSSVAVVGKMGSVRWLEAICVAVCNVVISNGSVGGDVLRRNGDRRLMLLPKTKGSIGGMLDEGISIEMSMLIGVEVKALTLVLDVLGVDGVGGGSVVEVDGLFEI
jgi:hypothetical protein